MSTSNWRRRFFKSTRGRIVRMLGEGKRTVAELAGGLELTDNAIRAHLLAMQRDGLVELVGTTPAVRRPNSVYDLTAAGHQLFPKANAVLLNEFLHAFAGRDGERKLEQLMQKVGKRLLKKVFPGIEKLPASRRVSRVLKTLENFGLLAGVEQRADCVVVRGCSCPVGEVAAAHPEICQVAAKLLGEILERDVTERCDRKRGARCVFEVAVR